MIPTVLTMEDNTDVTAQIALLWLLINPSERTTTAARIYRVHPNALLLALRRHQHRT